MVPELILTNAKIFKSLSGTCRILGHHVPGRRENLAVCEYHWLYVWVGNRRT